MANPEKVTVERSYFEALLRRADFHTSTQLLGRPDPANVSISRVEYDSLLRTAREYGLLKNALSQGGITEETLDLLISNSATSDQRKDSGVSANIWDQDPKDSPPTTMRPPRSANAPVAYREMPWRPTAPTLNSASGGLLYQSSAQLSLQSNLRIPSFQRHTSYGMSNMPDDSGLYEDEDFVDDANAMPTEFGTMSTGDERRTLYFGSLAERTTYRDLFSIIKGGKILSANLRPDRSATVTFVDGAAEFFAWAKRNDIYLNTKRIEVKWADRQYRLNTHISNRIASGASRNIVIHSAVEKSLTETQIRDDMDHIHNLVIINVTFRGDDAYVSTNSIHNALYARTCMMSRLRYKGCKIEFYRDECDVPLPTRTYAPKGLASEPPKKRPTITNRFGMLNIDASGGSSDEENRTPSDEGSDEGAADLTANVGVSLKFLDSDST